MAKLDDLAAAYIKLRDLKKQVKERHSEELRPINERMSAIENAMLEMLNKVGTESARTKAGTVYRSQRTSVKVQDWDEALRYVLDNGYHHMLVRRLSPEGVKDLLENTGELIPGVSLSTDLTVGVRRS